MKRVIEGGRILAVALFVVGVAGDAAGQPQSQGNDSADWCVVSGASCAGKEKAVSVVQGESASFEARLISPDKLNAGAQLPLDAYLAAGEWSSYCGEETACGVNPTVTINPAMLTFTEFTQGRDFTVDVFVGANVVPGEYKVKIKTFGPDNHHLNSLGWGFGSGISLSIMVTEAGSCAQPTLTIVAPAENTVLSICQVNATTLQGATPVQVSLEASSGITDFSALISRSDDSNPAVVTLVKTLGVDPATAAGTGSANGTIGGYKLTATATNACGTVTQTRLFAVNYVFDWLAPTPTDPKDGTTLPTKFSIRDCSGAFVADQTVEVTLSDGNGYSATRTFGTHVNTGVIIDTTEETYHTNYQLPEGAGVSYSVVVKFQGIQQGPTRTFTTKTTGGGGSSAR